MSIEVTHEETMATDHQILIQFTSGQPLATWSLGGKNESVISAQQGDTLSFSFDTPPGTLTDAMIFAGPRKRSPHNSPFQKNQIAIANGSKVKIENDGLW